VAKKKVLVIEDDAVYALLYKHALSALFELQCVDDSRKVPSEWLETADFIILDLYLRGNRDGIVEIRKFASLCPNAAIVIVSGATGKVVDMAVETAISHGLFVLGQFRKPLNVQALQLLLTGDMIKSPVLSHCTMPTRIAPAIIDDMITIEDVRGGIENKEFVAFFQPQIDLRTGRVCGLEALSRWDHPKHGTLTPNFFLEVMESVEMGVEFTLNILELALHGVQTIQNELRYQGSVSINVPMNAFRDPLFPDKVFSLLARRLFDPQKLVIEITEYGSLEGLHHVQESIARMMIRGIRLSIDDFGTGHSGLSRLRTLRFDELKVDRQFVTNLHNDVASQSILIAMANIAKSLNMSICVEGVETRETLEWLMGHREIICQGYLIAEPMRLTPLMDWFIARCQDFTLDLTPYLPEGTVVDLQSERDYHRAIVVVRDKECLEKTSQYVMKLEGRWHVEAFIKGIFAAERIFDARDAVDLAVIDLDLEDINSNMLISEIRSRYPACSIVGISKSPKESSIIKAFAHGANSFAIYSDSEQIIVSMLTSTIAGNASFSGKIVERLFKSERSAKPEAAITADFNLTAREIDTLRGIAAGMTYAQVARKMEISVSTVQSHIRNLYRKLSVDSQSKAIIKARSMGLLLGLDFTHSADFDTASQRPVSTYPHNPKYPLA